jgi:HAD superfamily hydrolase (TIGR01509 family)
MLAPGRPGAVAGPRVRGESPPPLCFRASEGERRRLALELALKAVSFDLFDTLVDLHMESLPTYVLHGKERRGTHAALHAAIARVAPVGFEDFASQLAAVDQELRDAREGRELPTLERFAELAKRLGIGAPGLAQQLTEIHMGAIRGQVRPLHHHAGILVQLHRRLRVGVCSNFSYAPAGRRVLEDCGLANALDCAVFSETVGWRKPRPEIFRALLEALAVEPGETLHVGDQLDADVRGAAALGIRTAWITRRVADPAAALQTYRGPAPDHVIADLGDLLRLVGAER